MLPTRPANRLSPAWRKPIDKLGRLQRFADVSGLMLKYGGGGHKAVGTCQVPYEQAEETLDELIGFIKSNGQTASTDN